MVEVWGKGHGEDSPVGVCVVLEVDVGGLRKVGDRGGEAAFGAGEGGGRGGVGGQGGNAWGGIGGVAGEGA